MCLVVSFGNTTNIFLHVALKDVENQPCKIEENKGKSKNRMNKEGIMQQTLIIVKEENKSEEHVALKL